MGSKASVLPALSRAVTQGSLRKLERRTQLHQLVLGKRLPMKFPRMPAAPRPCPPRKGHVAQFAFQPVCLPTYLPASCPVLRQDPPLPWGLWVSSEAA